VSDYTNIALRVSNLIRTRVQQDNTQGLADRELQILEHVTQAHSNSQNVFMEDGMSLKHLGSRYTLRKGIQVLIDLDYLIVESTLDSRQRRLVPAPAALLLFDTIGKDISEIVAA